MMQTVLLPALESALRAAGLWRKSAVLLLGLSGGADSVALLYTLALARKTLGLTVCACHVQHGLRGESTLEDERFVRALCAQTDIPLRVMQAGLNATMETPGVETIARDRRRLLFAECMEDSHADALLLGHHLDDQAETVLMRLLRGAGAKGLCGMRSCAPFGRGVVLRPFLGLRKEQLVQALRQEGYAYREDESNRKCLTPRNALRNRLLPELEALYPEAARHIAEAADSLREDEDCLSSLADSFFEEALCDGHGVFALAKAKIRFEEPGMNAALPLRILRRFYRDGLRARGLAPDERELSREQSHALLSVLSAPAGSAMNLPCGLQALCGARHLHLRMQSGEPLLPVEPPEPIAFSALMDEEPDSMAVLLHSALATLTASIRPNAPMNRPPIRFRFCDIALEAAPLSQPEAAPCDAREIILPEALLRQCALRTPCAGDTIHPFGAAGSKPLRRYLTDQKVDEPFRRRLPVLAIGSRVLWIPGLCTAEELRAKPATGEWRVTLCGEAPYLPIPKS